MTPSTDLPMNRLSEPHPTHSNWELPNTPPAHRPTMNMIAGEVARRRRRRRKLGTSLLGCFAIGLGGAIAFHSVAPFDSSPTSTEQTRSALSRHHDPDATAPSPQPLSQPSSQPAGFTLYASVRLETPVFRYDEQREAMVPLGWIRSTDMIPVDLDRLDPNEIENFQTFLNHEPEKVFF